jgi:vacuolar-type H+-ATPase subunit H
VEEEIQRYRARILGAGAKEREVPGQLAEELRALARAQPRFAKVVERLWAAGVLARATPRDAVVAALLRQMSFLERVTLLREQRRQMVEEASPRARNILRRRLRAAFAAREFGLQALSPGG